MVQTLAFISYNSKDKSVAQDIGLFLTAENVNIWYDEWRVGLGDSITGKITEGLEEQTHLILIWSKNASESDWVKREYLSSVPGYVRGKCKIIPVTLDDTPLPSIIADLKYHKYDNGSENNRKAIIDAVLGRNPNDEYTKAIVRKYHELISNSNSDSHMGVRACPQCGNSSLELHMHTDRAHDRMYFITECLECGWHDWSE